MLRARADQETVQGVRPDRDDGQGREPLVLRRLHAKGGLETEARRGDPLRDLRSDQQAATRRDTTAREARTGDRPPLLGGRRHALRTHLRRGEEATPPPTR